MFSVEDVEVLWEYRGGSDEFCFGFGGRGGVEKIFEFSLGRVGIFWVVGRGGFRERS